MQSAQRPEKEAVNEGGEQYSLLKFCRIDHFEIVPF